MTQSWNDLNQHLMARLATVDSVYRPTNFWQPGIAAIVDELGDESLASFKRWPSARSWFYPTYGPGYSREMADRMFDAVKNPRAKLAWVRSMLSGSAEARRDFDVACMAWDQDRWPFDLLTFGESPIGDPPQRFHLTASDDVHFGRGYLNYLLCLSGLSRHVEKPPQKVLEIGGGFGALADVLLPRTDRLTYLNLDIPPLLVVSAYYLQALAGDTRFTPLSVSIDGDFQSANALTAAPNWRIGDVVGPFDLFINSYSFQEMEPDVVSHYIDQVSRIGVDWVVSLNSKLGKRKYDSSRPGGSISPVKSSDIVTMFEHAGFRCVERIGSPLFRGGGELAILSLN